MCRCIYTADIIIIIISIIRIICHIIILFFFLFFITEALSDSPSKHLDIMAQQLKFVSCLKMMMEELATLATGCEVDGGQLRFQLYVWLEREVEALKEVCNYCCTLSDGGELKFYVGYIVD